MCIIAIKPKGVKMFDDQTITTMFINNPDGAGYMYYDKKHKNVCIKKGFFSCKALLADLKTHNFDDVNVVLHFRISTSGKIDSLNCHPYPLYGKNADDCTANLAMAHNGILTAFNPPKDSPINDTQTFINEVLNNLKPDFLKDADKLMLIKKLIGTNKLAFLDDTDNVTTIGDFITDGDYIYSNSSYKVSSLYPSTWSCTYKNVSTKGKKKAKKSKGYAYPRGTKPTIVSTKDDDGETCVYETRRKLDDDDWDFWKDEPNKFWDWYDRKHPADDYD